MKKLLLALVAMAGLMIAAPAAEADWIPKINANGTIDFWYDPVDPMPGTPPPHFPYVYWLYDMELGKFVWYAMPE